MKVMNVHSQQQNCIDYKEGYQVIIEIQQDWF